MVAPATGLHADERIVMTTPEPDGIVWSRHRRRMCATTGWHPMTYAEQAVLSIMGWSGSPVTSTGVRSRRG